MLSKVKFHKIQSLGLQKGRTFGEHLNLEMLSNRLDLLEIE